MLCLASVVYHEARSEPIHGQIAVAQVVLNRAGRNPARICPESRRSRQFHHRGRATDSRAWRTAVWAAQAAAFRPDITDGATHFHSGSERPWWTRRMTRTGRIGGHVFYRELSGK